MARLTKKQFEGVFREEILPYLIERERVGFPDKPGRRTAWNDTVDAYIRDGRLPEAAGNWGHPRWLETWSPKRSSNDYATKRGPAKKSPAQLDREIAEVLTEDFRVVVYGEPGKKPIHVSRWMTKAQADHALKNHRAMNKAQGHGDYEVVIEPRWMVEERARGSAHATKIDRRKTKYVSLAWSDPQNPYASLRHVEGNYPATNVHEILEGLFQSGIPEVHVEDRVFPLKSYDDVYKASKHADASVAGRRR